MHDRNRVGLPEATLATPLQTPMSASASTPSTFPASLPAARRTPPPYSHMGASDNGLFSLHGPLRSRLASVAGLFQLPNTLQGYLVFTFCLLILSFTMVLHITLSAELMRLDERLGAMKGQYEATERHNAGIVYEISRYGSLLEANKKALLAGYVPADKYQYVVDRPEVQEAIDNPQPTNLVPKYVILGGDPNAQVAPAPSATAAPEESAAESRFWSYFRWESVRDAWAETGSWLRAKLPSWGAP